MRLFHSVFRFLCLVFLTGQIGEVTGQEFHALSLEPLQIQHADGDDEIKRSWQADEIEQANFLHDLQDLESELMATGDSNPVSTVAYAGALPAVQEQSGQILSTIEVYEKPILSSIFSPNRWDISASLLTASRINERILAPTVPIEFGDNFDPGFRIKVGQKNAFGYDRVDLEMMNIAGSERRASSQASLDYDAAVRSVLLTVTPISMGTGTTDILLGPLHPA